MKTILITFWCITIPVFLFAQKAPVKFGKIDDAVVKMVTHPLDTSADAVVLMDYGVTRFRYDDSEGFLFDFTRILRIKILSKEGLKYADFETSYYNSGADVEKISLVKGYSYNYSKGKVEKSKLEKSSIFKEEVNDNWDKISITMPDVEVGTVIELTYKLTSPFKWNLQTWVFQSDIPTVHSEYKVAIPEYFDYQLLSSGYQPFSVNEKKTTSGSITLQTKSRTGGTGLRDGAVKTEYSTQKIDYRNFNFRWVAINVPAFKTEPYVASPSDYISKIEFELRGTQYPNSVYKRYMGNWASLNKTFLEHSRFGSAIKQTGYMGKELDVIDALSTDKEKVVAMVNLVRDKIEWNEEYRVYAGSTLRKAWTEHKGSTADINLTIVAGLKKLGLKAEPVLISTRGHGMIRDQYAISNQFNSVLASVKLDDMELLLDGTDRYLPIGVLPKKCLNGKGRRVSKNSPGWIKIKPTTKEARIVQATFDLEPSGSLSGTVELTEIGYAGYSQHKKLKLNGEEDFLADFQEKNEAWLIDEYTYDKEAGYDKPFESKYVLELNEDIIVAGDRIYFNPTIDEIMDENPFKLEKREYPVDFAYPTSNSYTINFKIPEGYEVEELPKTAEFSMPNKDGVFSYEISNTNNEIQLKVNFEINKVLFAQTEYAQLKQFYHQVVQKCEEQVVLKKTT